MARLLKEPVKKKTLKGIKKGLQFSPSVKHTHGKLNHKNTKSGKNKQ